MIVETQIDLKLCTVSLCVVDMYIYIGGDSYCFYRDNPAQHWPAGLAQALSLKLEGQGFPGQGWWPTRQHFVDYCNSSKFQSTKIFIFCHTDIHRPLTGNKIWSYGFSQEMIEFHTKYISELEVDLWTTENWYKEINARLFDKTVLHLSCFDSNKTMRSCLAGKVFDTSLVDVSIVNNGGDLNTHRSKTIIDKINAGHNHLTVEGNLALANFLVNSFASDETKIVL